MESYLTEENLAKHEELPDTSSHLFYIECKNNSAHKAFLDRATGRYHCFKCHDKAHNPQNPDYNPKTEYEFDLKLD